MISWALKMAMYAMVATGVLVIAMDIGSQDRGSSGSQASAVHDDDGDDGDDGDRRRLTVRTARDNNNSGSDAVRKLRIPATTNGQFFVDAQVNGKTISFLVDTGASDVVLTQKDARKLGIIPSNSDYTMRYQTANGVIRAAPVTLRKIKIRRLALYNIHATVNESPMAISLLGMGFLNQLRSYEVKNNTLTMQW